MAWDSYLKFADPRQGIKVVGKGAKGIFGSGKSGLDAASPYLDQIPGMAREQLNPYINQGQTAGNAAQGTYGNMAQGAPDFYNDLFSKYSESEGFKRSRDNALKNARASAAGGGFSGTPYDQEQQMRLANDLGREDYQQYFNNIRNMQDTGLGGQEKAAERGFGANQDLTSILGQMLNAKGGMAFQDVQQNKQNKAGMMKLLAQLLGGAGGAILGGPAGAAVGSSIGGGLANKFGGGG